MAGGDGTLMTLLMKAKENGVDVGRIVCCILPYGTGNDFARVSGWGGTPSGPLYETSLRHLIKELCLNSYEKKFNVWSIMIKYKPGGTSYDIDSKTREFVERNETVFEKYMINYFGIGEDGRLGLDFERNRTKYRWCNKAVYGWVGVKNFFNCCRGGLSISE